MFTKKQISTIIKVLKDKYIGERPALRQVFEQGGFLWATNGYVALELGEVKEENKNKCMKLESLVGWYGTHKTSDKITLLDLAEDNECQEPDMCKLLHNKYIPATNVKIDMQYLTLATSFLEVDKICFEESIHNKNLFRIKPLEKMSIMNEAMEIKAYLMGLK